GKHIAFSLFVPEQVEPLIKLPKPPKGAQWAAPPKIITKLQYRMDGKGYLRDGYYHLFVISAEGGLPQPLTDGPYHHRPPLNWTATPNSPCGPRTAKASTSCSRTRASGRSASSRWTVR